MAAIRGSSLGFFPELDFASESALRTLPLIVKGKEQPRQVVQGWGVRMLRGQNSGKP